MQTEPHIQLAHLPVWDRMGPIALEEMDAIKLMNRIDTKYVTTEPILAEVLQRAAENGYRVLVTDGNRLSPYNSMYYDTEGLKMYLDHHNRRLTRQKIRTRVYLSSGLAFLEIKRKNNKGRTKKKRVQIASDLFEDFRQDEAAAQYVAQHSDFIAGDIAPHLETQFRRITLVNAAKTERLTIDSQLRFVNRVSGRTAELGTAVIIELKQDGRAKSEMKDILKEFRVKQMSVSKYCIGTALTDPGAKNNRFKLKIRKIEKIINDKITIV